MKKITVVSVVLVVVILAAVFYMKKPAVSPEKTGQAVSQGGVAIAEVSKDTKGMNNAKSECENGTKFKDVVANYGKTWAYSSSDPLKTGAQGVALSDIDKLKKEIFKTYSCLSLAGGKNRCEEFLGQSRKREDIAMREECSVAYGKTGFMAYAAGDAKKRGFCSLHYKYIVAEDSKYVSEEEFCAKAGQGLENLKELCAKFPGKAKDQCLVYFDENKCKNCKGDWDLYRAFKNPENIKSLPPETQNAINALKAGSQDSCGETLVVSEYCGIMQTMKDKYEDLVANQKKK